jgi:hypothetical protein
MGPLAPLHEPPVTCSPRPGSARVPRLGGWGDRDSRWLTCSSVSAQPWGAEVGIPHPGVLSRPLPEDTALSGPPLKLAKKGPQ